MIARQPIPSRQLFDPAPENRVSAQKQAPDKTQTEQLSAPPEKKRRKKYRPTIDPITLIPTELGWLTEQELNALRQKNPELRLLAGSLRVLGQHPLAACMPWRSLDEYLALKENIAMNGIHTPIVIYEGRVLDGWMRYCACLSLNISCPQVDLADMDALTFMVRNLRLRLETSTQDQRALALAMMLSKRPSMPS